VLKLPPLGDRRERKGFFVSVAGRKGANVFDGALVIIKSLFVALAVAYTGALLFRSVDEEGDIAKHPNALRQAFLAGQELVED